MTWRNRPTNYSKQAKKDSVSFATDAALRILRGLIAISPIDTGRFRGNWVVGVGSRDYEQVDAVISPATALGSGRAELNKARFGQEINISNNLLYAAPLNDGSSQQAPANFVQGIVARVARRLK
jgi:hypothetical protein